MKGISENKKILIYGFGNPGRQDDGLGPAVIERLESEGVAGIVTDCNYQLNIEDAIFVSEHDIVVFVDASIDAVAPFSFAKTGPSVDITFTTHSMSPESVLALCADLYGKNPEAYVLGIRGYEFDFETALTPEAEENFYRAYSFLTAWLRETCS